MAHTWLDPAVRFLPSMHSWVVKTAPEVNGLTYVMGVCAHHAIASDQQQSLSEVAWKEGSTAMLRARRDDSLTAPRAFISMRSRLQRLRQGFKHQVHITWAPHAKLKCCMDACGGRRQRRRHRWHLKR